MAIPFNDRFPAGVLLPSCRHGGSLERVMEHYQSILARDPALVMACMEGLSPEDAVSFLLAEVREKARKKKEVLEALEKAFAQAIEECLR